jgi:SAM-dependent methyltransferase
VAAQCGVIAQQKRLFDRLLGILSEEGVLASAESEWIVQREADDIDALELCKEIVARTAYAGSELTLIERCGTALADVLTGRADPLSLLFPSGSQALVEHMYQDAAPARAFNEMLAEAVAAAVSSLPVGRRLRVLEIGGGTGSTTSFVVPRLPADRTDYVFTDVSPLFVARARDKFSAYPFLIYKPLDIERVPALQALEPHSFDLVIASNVLHATKDMRQTMTHVRRALKSGGLVVMLEVTTVQRWLDVTFGMTDGWWRFTDSDLRTNNPLLRRDQWTGLLSASGFDEVRLLPEKAPAGTLDLQSVVIARSGDQPVESGAASAEPRRWLVFAGHDGVGQAVAERLTSAGDTCVVATCGDGPAQAVTVDPTDQSAYERLVRDARPTAGVIHCPDFDSESGADPSLDNRSGGCRSVLHLAQALLKVGGPPPRLSLVTRGAQSVDGSSSHLAPLQAGVWGLGHAIALEHPELRCVCMDVDPDSTAEEAAALLFAELRLGGAEDRVAYRHGSRFVARLVGAGRNRPSPSVAAPYRLEVRERGSFDRLEMTACALRAPAAGEVEIRVRATALNFRDVLNTLGLYPGDPGPLGSECAGTVTAVWGGTTSWSPGASVISVPAPTD